MGVRLYREYHLKFYLNARHHIVINGQAGETHPHTWEFSLNIRIARGSFTPFMTFEQKISEFLARYQNQDLNKIPPFGEILPTLENMVDYFAAEFERIIREIGGSLRRVEASETPSRSYILDIRQAPEDEGTGMREMSKLVDSILDDILIDGWE